MTPSITEKQQEVLAEILSASVHLYGWASAKTTHHNRVTIGKATESERKMTPYDTLSQKGLVTLHTSAQGEDSLSTAFSHVEITPAGITLAEKAFNTFYTDTFEQYLERAETNRKGA